MLANGGGSTVNLNGAVNIVAENNSMGTLIAQSGIINVNDAGGNIVKLQGNIVAADGSVNSAEPQKETIINVKLDTADSSFTGAAYNQFGKGILPDRSADAYTGSINLTV